MRDHIVWVVVYRTDRVVWGDDGCLYFLHRVCSGDSSVSETAVYRRVDVTAAVVECLFMPLIN